MGVSPFAAVLEVPAWQSTGIGEPPATPTTCGPMPMPASKHPKERTDRTSAFSMPALRYLRIERKEWMTPVLRAVPLLAYVLGAASEMPRSVAN